MPSKKQNTEVGIVLTLALLIAGKLSNNAVFFDIAIATLLITSLFPLILTPFSWLWLKIADFLETVSSTVLLSIIFFLIVTPVGIIRRKFAKDSLQLRNFKKNTTSVFVVEEKTYTKKDLENQY